jgi:hypothetical protein
MGTPDALLELGASIRTLVHAFGDVLEKDRRKVLPSLSGKLGQPVEYVPE